ncbi:site-specific integrase [Pseudoalteromonas sp. CnMc7-15]|uniref:site-specific integrase n=1 Tax=unclassified Pseudoalteromonas TaxID=194690 RepID=UPI001EF6414D|nr:site-specific integrase [Pseudoalteromonas sp. CnMc7-15]MCG7567102.1 site-specific integrase [Pseudoalteromonas sp. CnMc7-15]
MGEKRGKKLPRGVRIRTQKSGAQTLYIHFTYQGVKCPEPLSGRPVDESNIKYAERLRGEILNKIQNNTFVYADYFPASAKLALFGSVKSTDDMAHYLDLYLEHAERRGLKPSSLVTYKSRKAEIETWVGKLRPETLTLAKIRDLAIDMHNKGHSYTTIRNCFKVLRGALDEAAMNGAIPANPIIGFRLSNYVSQPKRTITDDEDEQIDPFTPSELSALVGSCRSNREKLMLMIWAKTGLRTGELCALKWANLNVKRGYIKIRENYVSMVATLGTTKTDSGTREIDLDDETIELFEQQRSLIKSGDLVFQNDRAVSKAGFDSYSIRRWFVRLCKDAGVRYRYAYHLRHTFATIHISQGTNLWQLAEWLGHKSPEMLYKHYGSFIKEYADKDRLF